MPSMQTRAVLTIFGVVVALAIYYSTQTKSGYFYYTKDGQKVEVRQRE